MSEILSQEQIDALMASEGLGGFDDSPLDEGGGGADEGAKDYNALSDVFKIFAQSSQSTIHTLINKEVNAEVQSVVRGSADSVSDTFSEPLLAVRIPYEQGLKGELLVLLTPRVAAALSDLMMMGDGSAEYSEEHKDAIAEIFNQICGAFNTEFGGTLNKSIANGSIGVDDVDPSNPPFAPDSFDMVPLKVSVEGMEDAQLLLFISDELSGAICAAAGGGSSKGQSDITMDELDDLSSMASGFENSSAPVAHQPSFSSAGSANDASIQMLLDVELDVSIELGSTELPIKRVLELAPGAIIELDRMAGEPVDLLVNGKVVAKGEIVVVDESFGIRIVSLISPEERLKSLR
jgi:flagellar motor switch protein FliN/FliY